LDQQLKMIQQLRQEISDLKKENGQLKEDLQSIARIAHNIYMYLGSGTMDTTNKAVAIRDKVMSLFKSVHKYLALSLFSVASLGVS